MSLADLVLPSELIQDAPTQGRLDLSRTYLLGEADIPGDPPAKKKPSKLGAAARTVGGGLAGAALTGSPVGAAAGAALGYKSSDYAKQKAAERAEKAAGEGKASLGSRAEGAFRAAVGAPASPETQAAEKKAKEAEDAAKQPKGDAGDAGDKKAPVKDATPDDPTSHHEVEGPGGQKHRITKTNPGMGPPKGKLSAHPDPSHAGVFVDESGRMFAPASHPIHQTGSHGLYTMSQVGAGGGVPAWMGGGGGGGGVPAWMQGGGGVRAFMQQHGGAQATGGDEGGDQAADQQQPGLLKRMAQGWIRAGDAQRAAALAGQQPAPAQAPAPPAPAAAAPETTPAPAAAPAPVPTPADTGAAAGTPSGKTAKRPKGKPGTAVVGGEPGAGAPAEPATPVATTAPAPTAPTETPTPAKRPTPAPAPSAPAAAATPSIPTMGRRPASTPPTDTETAPEEKTTRSKPTPGTAEPGKDGEPTAIATPEKPVDTARKKLGGTTINLADPSHPAGSLVSTEPDPAATKKFDIKGLLPKTKADAEEPASLADKVKPAAPTFGQSKEPEQQASAPKKTKAQDTRADQEAQMFRDREQEKRDIDRMYADRDRQKAMERKAKVGKQIAQGGKDLPVTDTARANLLTQPKVQTGAPTTATSRTLPKAAEGQVKQAQKAVDANPDDTAAQTALKKAQDAAQRAAQSGGGDAGDVDVKVKAGVLRKGEQPRFSYQHEHGSRITSRPSYKNWEAAHPDKVDDLKKIAGADPKRSHRDVLKRAHDASYDAAHTAVEKALSENPQLTHDEVANIHDQAYAQAKNAWIDDAKQSLGIGDDQAAAEPTSMADKIRQGAGALAAPVAAKGRRRQTAESPESKAVTALEARQNLMRRMGQSASGIAKQAVGGGAGRYKDYLRSLSSLPPDKQRAAAVKFAADQGMDPDKVQELIQRGELAASYNPSLERTPLLQEWI